MPVVLSYRLGHILSHHANHGASGLDNLWPAVRFALTMLYTKGQYTRTRSQEVSDAAIARLRVRESAGHFGGVSLRKRSLADYQDRNTILRQLGYGSYANYLRSPTWDSIRRRVLKRDNYNCFICGRDATMVHHTTYTLGAMKGRDISGMFSVCRKCHNTTHLDDTGKHCGLRDCAGRFGIQFSRHDKTPEQSSCAGKAGCRIKADRIRDGQWFCHIHDPNGKFQRKLNQRRSRVSGGSRSPDSTGNTPQNGSRPPGTTISCDAG